MILGSGTGVTAFVGVGMMDTEAIRRLGKSFHGSALCASWQDVIAFVLAVTEVEKRYEKKPSFGMDAVILLLLCAEVDALRRELAASGKIGTEWQYEKLVGEQLDSGER